MATEVKEIISDEEIARVHGNANFGAMDKRQVVNQGGDQAEEPCRTCDHNACSAPSDK